MTPSHCTQTKTSANTLEQLVESFFLFLFFFGGIQVGFFFFLSLNEKIHWFKHSPFFRFSNADRNAFNKQCMILRKPQNYTTNLLGSVWKLSKKHIPISLTHLVLSLLFFQLRSTVSMLFAINFYSNVYIFNRKWQLILIPVATLLVIAHNCLIPKYSAKTANYPLILSRKLDWPVSYTSLD